LDTEQTNIAETLAREMKQPIGLVNTENGWNVFALPEGWQAKEFDLEKFGKTPRRMKGTEQVSDDQKLDQFSVTAVLNDLGWRDHRVMLSPRLSKQWETWIAKNGKHFEQAEFAAFMESNIRDISANSMPSGADILHMILNMESMQNVAFKSSTRLEDGSVQFAYIEESDAKTQAKMQMFSRFQLAIPVLHGGLLYPVDARLRYRIRDAKLIFWFELDHPELAFETVMDEMLDKIGSALSLPIINGQP